MPIEHRLDDHRYTARVQSFRPISKAIIDCGDFVVTRLIEVVPVEEDWCARERYWISILRILFPGCVNVSDGGSGPAGWVPSEETRERLRQVNLGRKHPPGTGAKIAAKTRGQVRTAETRARMSAARKGEIRSEEQKEKIRSTLTGRKLSPSHCEAIRIGKEAAGPVTLSAEHRAAISAARKGKPLSAEHRAKLSSVLKGIPLTPEQYARVSVMHKGRKRSAETLVRMSAAQKGKIITEEQKANMRAAWVLRKTRGPVSAETRLKLSAAGKGRKHSPEHCAKLKAAWERRRLSVAKAVDNT